MSVWQIFKRWCPVLLSFSMLLVVGSPSWGLDVTATRSITGPDAEGALTITIQVNVSVAANESAPAAMIVREYIPPGSTIGSANPAFDYHLEEAGEIA